MGRWLALLSTAALVIAAAATDLPETCKRQPFRGRCPSIGGQPPKRSQFVLRYYARNGECVSYPYGHCANDDRELQLFRYKEECEASCLRENGELDAPGNQTSIKEGSEDNQTYGTVPPLKQPPTIASTENQETQATTEEVTSTTTVSTTTSNTPAPTTTTSEPTTVTTTTEKATTTTTTTQEETTTVGTTPSTTVSTTPPPSTTTTEKTSPSTTTTHAPERATVTVHESTNVSDEENTVEEEEDDVKETSPSVTTTTAATTSAPRTECERRRAASSSSKIRGGFVPVCDVNGNFQKVQCEPDNRQCFCVNSAGIEITNSRTRNGSKPDCEKIEAAVTPKTQSCRGPSERGPCSSSFPRFYFDETLQRCVAFTYSGCGGNGNSYETEGDCQRQCAPKPATKPVVEAVKTVQKPAVSESHDVCSLPKERGPCDKYELRFYYNSDTNECKYFFWGGCEGNANNFETAEACHASCGVTKGTAHSTTKATPTSGRITPNAVESKRQPQTNAGMVPGTIPGVRVTPSAEPNGSQTTTTTLPEEGSDEEFIPEEPKIDDEAGPTTTTPVPTTPRVVPRTFPTRPSPSQRLPVATNAPVHPTQAPTEPHIVSRNNNGVFLRPGDEETADSDNRCAHPLDAGTCRGQFVRWYWNDEKKICDVFTYSGCEGNGNNFASKEECFAICHKEPVVVTTAAPDFSNVCKHDVDAGECNGVFQRFAFDNEAGECRPFTYGGCGGNGNNFATIAECRSKCQKTKSQPLNVCEFEIEAGECTGVFPRFAYDRETNDCRPFTYGGCGGNGNNFANINECRNVCIQKSCQAIGQCDTTRCQVVNDSRGCPFCSCSPIKAPPPTAPCPPIDATRCQEPCLVINNRRGCQECACPKIHSSPIPPVALPPAPNTGAPGSQNEGPRAPATPSVVAPPGTSSHPQPPAPRTPATTAVPRGPLPPSFASEIEEKCHQPLDPGPCKNFDDRWFFNQEDGSCHPFKYGGCAGNRNHFFTQRECEIHCARFLINPMAPNELTSSTSHEHVDARDNSPEPTTTGTRAPLSGNRALAFDLPSFVRGQQKLESGPSVKEWPETYDNNVPVRLEVHREVHEVTKAPVQATHPTTMGQRITRIHIEHPHTVENSESAQKTFTDHTKVEQTAHQEQRIHSTADEIAHQERRTLLTQPIRTYQHIEHIQQPLSIHKQPTTPSLAVHQQTSVPEISQQTSHPEIVHQTAAPEVIRHATAERIPEKPFVRQEAVRTEKVASRPIQEPTYAMNAVSSYNPQMNPNLEALSPPVDPTYFTYNSQHLGQRRQFAVNSVPFDKNAPNQLPPQGFAPLANRPQVIQTEAERRFEHALTSNTERVDTPWLQGKPTQQPSQFASFNNQQSQPSLSGQSAQGFRQGGSAATVSFANPGQLQQRLQAPLPRVQPAGQDTQFRNVQEQQNFNAQRGQEVQQQQARQLPTTNTVAPSHSRNFVASQGQHTQFQQTHQTFQQVHQETQKFVANPVRTFQNGRQETQQFAVNSNRQQSVERVVTRPAPSVSVQPTVARGRVENFASESRNGDSQKSVTRGSRVDSSLVRETSVEEEKPRTVPGTNRNFASTPSTEHRTESTTNGVTRQAASRGERFRQTEPAFEEQERPNSRLVTVSADRGHQDGGILPANSNFGRDPGNNVRSLGSQQTITQRTGGFSATTPRFDSRIPARPVQTTPFIEPIRQLFQPKQNAVKTAETQEKLPLENLPIHPIEHTTPMIPKRIVFHEEERDSQGPVVHGIRNTPYGQTHWVYYEGDYYGPLIPGVKINKTAPVDVVDGTITVKESDEAKEAFEVFKQQASQFQQSVASYIKSKKEHGDIRNSPLPSATGKPLLGFGELEEVENMNEFHQGSPQVKAFLDPIRVVETENRLNQPRTVAVHEIRIPLSIDEKKQDVKKLESAKNKEGSQNVELPRFLLPPPSTNQQRNSKTLNPTGTLTNAPYDNFQRYLKTNSTILLGREEEFEGDDESVEVEHPRQHGVKEVEVKTPIEVDNYKTPNPPLRGVYGKKNDEPATTQGVKITTTTTAQPTRAARISSTTTASTTVSTSTATTPLVEEKNDDETEAAEEEDATEAATTAVEEPEEFEKDEVESTPEVEEEEPTTVVYTSASSTTVRPTTSTTASSTTTAAAARPSDEEEVVEQTEEEEEHEQEEVEERVSVGNIETTSVAATTVVDETETTNESEVTTAATTAVPDVKTTLFNEIDSMEGDDEVEENEVAPNTMMASSKFAVHRNTEEVKKFEEVENTPKPQKIDEVKAVTLKKVEITRVPPSTTTVPSTVQSTTVAPTTAEPQSTAVPTAETEESVDTSSPVAETTTVARTASTSTSSAAATTTGAPVKTSHIDISTTESTTPVPTTSVRSTTVATTTRGSTASTTEILESDESTEVADIDMTKIIQEGTVLKKDIGVIDPSTPIGREPNPSVATGIGREVQTLPPDVMKDLDEPTTIRPPATPEAPVRPSTASPTTTRAFRTLPQATTITKTNSATHNTRPENFETDPRIICSMPADAGICTNYVARWFYNAHTGQCEQFSYGSCGGNLNNFADRTSCELRCLASHPAIHSQVPERCSQEKDSGEGDGYNVKWYFNMRNLRCEQFVYLGQGGNSNQFETLSDCERFCSPQPTRPPRPTLATAPPTTAPSSPAPHRPETQRPLQELPEITQPTSLSGGDEDYDSSEDNEDTIPDKEFTDISKVDLPTLAPPPRPNAVQQGDGLAVQHPASEPRPPSAQGTKIITEEEVKAPKAQSTAAPTTAATTTTQRPTSSATAPTQGPPQQSKSVYDAQIIKTSDVVYNGRESSIVAASPKQGIDYATGRVIAPGLKNVEGRIPVKDLTSEIDDAKNARPSCPNGKKELLYADGRSVQCLPGWKHCPDKSVCYFNGVDYFCCPNEDDPYDRHVFGGYGGEEERNGYKVFGPLGAGRRLMDDIILPREKRQTSMDRAFNTNPVSFNLDSVVAPLRFDAEKPKHISKAGVMRRVPQKPKHGNPMCILPLVKGDCSAAHLRYYYDRNSDSCRLFYYSGCQGNGNNFGSLEDCQRLCVLGGQIAPAVQTDAVTPATIVAAGQCPSGSPLGGNAPVLCGNSTDSIGCPSGFYCRSGPPDICCPGVDPNAKAVQHGVKVLEETTPLPGQPRSYYKEALLATPTYMCPDASDPLMGSNGSPLMCGAGFDGVQMCPKGYYCAIDGAKGSRLCCPLFGAAQRLPTDSVIAPYFGRRSPNPGEVIDRGSLPSDQENFRKHSSAGRSEEIVTKSTEQPTTTAEADEYDDEDQHLMLKPTDRRHEILQQTAASVSPKASDVEAEAVNIDVPTEAPVPEEVEPTTSKVVMDKSICHMKPTEGRACREDEKPPRTNLHYFYSAKDNRCKLYFYRGCGGNENRFEKKADCEAMCLHA